MGASIAAEGAEDKQVDGCNRIEQNLIQGCADLYMAPALNGKRSLNRYDDFNFNCGIIL